MMRRRTIATVVAAVALGLGLWMRPLSSPEPPEVPPLFEGPVVATVDGTPILLDQVASLYRSQSPIHGADVKPAAWKEFLLTYFVQLIVYQKEAENRHLDMSAAELALYLSGVTGITDQAGLKALLENSHATMPQLEYRAYLDKLASRLYIDVTKDVDVSEEEVRKYFNEHKGEFNVRNEDPMVAYNALKPEILQTLLTQKQDAAWVKWRDAQTAKYKLEVKMEDWWQQVQKAVQPSPTPSPSLSQTGSTP